MARDTGQELGWAPSSRSMCPGAGAVLSAKVPAAHRAVGGMKKLGLSQKQWGAEGFRHAEVPSCPEMGGGG